MSCQRLSRGFDGCSAAIAREAAIGDDAAEEELPGREGRSAASTSAAALPPGADRAEAAHGRSSDWRTALRCLERPGCSLRGSCKRPRSRVRIAHHRASPYCHRQTEDQERQDGNHLHHQNARDDCL